MIQKMILALSLVLASTQVGATIYYSTGTTSIFTDGTTWENGCSGSTLPTGTPAPSTTDTIVLCSGTTVTLAAPASIADIQFTSSSTLNLGTHDLTVNASLTGPLGTPNSTISGSGAIVLSDADHTITLRSQIIPKLTLANPTANRTLTFMSNATFTALSGTPATSAGKGFIFNANSVTVTFPVGTTIAYCDKIGIGSFVNLTCTNPTSAAPPPAVSAPIFSLKDKPVMFSEELH